jgi:hypothetical protein
MHNEARLSGVLQMLMWLDSFRKIRSPEEILFVVELLCLRCDHIQTKSRPGKES